MPSGVDLDVAGLATAGVQIQTNLKLGVNLSNFDFYVTTNNNGPELKLALGIAPSINAVGSHPFENRRTR